MAQLDALQDDDGDCEIWPENWDTVLAFLNLQTCWRKQYLDMVGQIVWEGFYWADIAALLQEIYPKRKRRREIVEGLRIMESAALEILNKPKK